MSTKSKMQGRPLSKMVVRLWLIMMALVVFAIGLMWVIQVWIMENNYVDMSVNSMREHLQPVMEELETEDLAEHGELLSYMSLTADGKMLLVSDDGSLMGMYSYGHPIDIESEDYVESDVWKGIRSSGVYQSVLNREKYSREIRVGSHLDAYEMGIPVLYDGKPAYAILHQSFSELYQVLEMNRRFLIFLSILLTLVSSVLAAALSKSFVSPIHEIKKTVDDLAGGNLSATTELKRKDEIGDLADSVRELGRALQRLDTLRKEVIANVSHELRSPLALIGGYAEMVRDIHWMKEENREEDLNLIMKESKRMSEMVSDILDYSQLQAGYLQLRREWYNLYEIIESEIVFCRQSAQEQGIALQFSFFGTEAVVFVDALKISQVIRNLLYNAINHTKDGQIVLVELTEHGDSVYRAAVKNQGDPIPEEERKLIWERYQRSQHQGGRNEGTGLGLSIVSAILKAHDLPYGVDCQDGMTVFWFDCPKGEVPE